MDVFIFPSETDAFGNVIQEASGSGVVPIVTDKGGPQSLVREGETGFIARDRDEFATFVLELMDDRDKLAKMKLAARQLALSKSWNSVFDCVYEAYKETWEYLEKEKEARKHR